MTRARLAFFGFATDVTGQAVLIAVTFLTTPVILALTSESLYGFWITTSSILGYLGLVDLGIGISLIRMVATLPADDGDSERLGQIAAEGLFLFATAALIFSVVGLLASPHVTAWFRIPPSEAGEIVSAYKLAVIGGAIALPLSTFTGVLSGLQRMAVSNVIRMCATIFGTLLSLILLKAGMGLRALPVGTLVGLVVSAAGSYIAIRQYRSGFRLRFRRLEASHLRALLAYGGFFQIGRIGNTIAISADSVLIAVMLGAAYVTPYSLTSKLAVLFSIGLASKLPTALLPAAAQMFAQNELETLRQLFLRLTFYAARFAVVTGAFLLFANRDFVTLWVGPQYYGGALLNAVFVVLVFQDTIYRGTTGVLYASDDMGKWAVASVIEGALNVVISIMLARRLGLVGIALGTSIAKALTTGVYIPHLICRRLLLPVRLLLRDGIVQPVLRSAPGVAITAGVALLLPRPSWVSICCIGVVATASNLLLFEGRAVLFGTEARWWRRVQLAYSQWPRV